MLMSGKPVIYIYIYIYIYMSGMYISLYHSKGHDEGYPKMQVLSNLSNFAKSYGHLSEILAFSSQALTKYG